jgi:hypothetical protein
MIGRHTGRVELSGALTSEGVSLDGRWKTLLPFGRVAER